MRLAEALAGMRALKTLSLEENRLDVEAALVLAAALELNRSLTSLSLAHNPIGPLGIRTLLCVIDATGAHMRMRRLALAGCAQMIAPPAGLRGGDGSGKPPPGYERAEYEDAHGALRTAILISCLHAGMAGDVVAQPA